MNLIYGGNTNWIISNVQFPSGFILSANPKHHSNEGETTKTIIDIILPCVKSVRETLHLSDDFPALLILDVFQGLITTAVRELLNEHNVLVSFVPNNMTHLFQPLDLTVNSWAKKFMKDKYLMWKWNFRESLDKGISIDNIDIKPLTFVKPLNAKWLIDLYDELLSENAKEIIISGRRAAGILKAVRKGSVNLPYLPFIDPF